MVTWSKSTSLDFWGQPESNRRAFAVALFLMSPYTRFSRVSLALRATMYGRGNTSNRHILQTQYMVRRRELILNAHIQWVIFFALFRQCALPAGRALSGFVYRIRQAVCKLRVCLCTGTSDAGISAPRWAQIGNVCVSFHAVSIHTSRLFCPAVLMRTLGHILSGAVTDRRLISLAAKNSK